MAQTPLSQRLAILSRGQSLNSIPPDVERRAPNLRKYTPVSRSQMKKSNSMVWYCVTVLVLGACAFLLWSKHNNGLATNPNSTDPSDVVAQILTMPGSSATNRPGDIKIYTYEIAHAWPHDHKAFTQGLVYREGLLIESTGMNGQSSLRKVELETGRVLQKIDLPRQYFAEGLAELGGKLFQLTWQNGKCFVYNFDTLRLEKDLTYSGEGWGLTTDGELLLMSDGTDQIRYVDPTTFEVKRTLKVTARGQPVKRLNELEFIKGEIWANIWQTEYIARIDPATGKVVGLIDLTNILPPPEHDFTTDVLNGIAYDAATDRVFVTGKNWPKLFEIRVKPKP